MMSEELPESFIKAMKDIEEGKTVPLDKALNEAPPSKELKKIFRDLDKLEAEKETWKEMYEMQSKLVLNLELNKIEREKNTEQLKLDVQILTKALEESQLKYNDVHENIIKKVYSILGMSYPLSVFDIPHEVEKLNEKSDYWKNNYCKTFKSTDSLYKENRELKQEVKGLQETLKLQKHVYDVGAEDLELDKKELYKRIEFLEEKDKALANCIEKCWNCFGESKFKIWDFVDGLELLVEKVQDIVEDERKYEKIVDKTYDILAGDPPVDLPKGILSIPEYVEKMFGELKDLVIENKRLEDKVERYREKNKTLQSYVDNIYENLKQMTGEK
jgi:FtsZ-binding cell division protein ZapB